MLGELARELEPTATPTSMPRRVSSATSVRTRRTRSSGSCSLAAPVDLALVRLVEPAARLQRLVEDALQLRRGVRATISCASREALGRRSARRRRRRPPRRCSSGPAWRRIYGRPSARRAGRARSAPASDEQQARDDADHGAGDADQRVGLESTASGISSSTAAITAAPSRSAVGLAPRRVARAPGTAHAPSSPSAAPLAPSAKREGLERSGDRDPAHAAGAEQRRRPAGPWRRSSSQPKSAIATTARRTRTRGCRRRTARWRRATTRRRAGRAPPRPRGGTPPASQASDASSDASTSATVANGRESARMPGISPGRSAPRGAGAWRAQAAGDDPPRRVSSFGARLRSRVPQYGHSVTYGLTSEPQLLQTTKRSGPLDIAASMLRRARCLGGGSPATSGAPSPRRSRAMTSRRSWLAS